MHYIKTDPDHEVKITPVGVYSSLGIVDYFAFQKSTKTFKIDFLEPLSNNMNLSLTNDVNKLIPERKAGKKMPFRSEENENKKDFDNDSESAFSRESEINFIEKKVKVTDKIN